MLYTQTGELEDDSVGEWVSREFYEWWCGLIKRTFITRENVTSNKKRTSLLTTLVIVGKDFLLNV
jgi:hypothetical protein